MLIQFYSDKGEFLEVENYASELAKSFNTFDGYITLSQAMGKRGLLEDSIKLLERGLKNYPKYTIGYDQLVNLYYQINDTAGILRTLEKWGEVAPDDTVIKSMIEELEVIKKNANP